MPASPSRSANQLIERPSSQQQQQPEPDDAKNVQTLPETAQDGEQQQQADPLNQQQNEESPKKLNTANYTDYQRVWILICLDRARSILGKDSSSKIDSKMHNLVCEFLQVEQERSQITRRPTILSLRHIWKVFSEQRVISKPNKGGPKPKKCREQVEFLLKQNLSFRQIAKQLKPEITISPTTVGRIAEEMKKRENKRPRKKAQQASNNTNNNN